MTYKLVSVLGIIFGFILIIATLHRWKFLTDSPEELSWCYSHSWLKKLFGGKILIYFNYLVGLGMILIGIYLLLNDKS